MTALIEQRRLSIPRPPPRAPRAPCTPLRRRDPCVGRQNERFYATNPPGVVTGLAWTSMGGAMLYVEMQPLGPPAPTAARRQRKGGAAAEGGDGAAGGGDDDDEGGGGGGGGASLRHTGQI